MPSFLGHPRATTILLPAPVYATWNPAGTGTNITLSNGNLVAQVTGPTASTAYGAAATSGYSFDDGKRYLEIEIENISGSASGIALGFADSDQALGYELGDLPHAYAWRADGFKENNGVASPLGNVAVNGDVVRLAIHAYVDEGVAKANIWFGVNSAWLGAGNPEIGVNPAFIGVIAPLATDWGVRATMKETGDTLIANFGASPFYYGVPSGFGSGWGANIS